MKLLVVSLRVVLEVTEAMIVSLLLHGKGKLLITFYTPSCC